MSIVQLTNKVACITDKVMTKIQTQFTKNKEKLDLIKDCEEKL